MVDTTTLKTMVKRKLQRVHNHKLQQISYTKSKRKETQTNKRKKTNARKAHRPALSFPRDVIAILKGLKTQGPNTRKDLI